MQTQIAPRLHLGRRKGAETPLATHADAGTASTDGPEMRRALPILAAWLAFYAIAVIGCLNADRQQAAQQATTATAAAETVGAAAAETTGAR